MTTDWDQRLSSGLTLREAFSAAAIWWDRTARHILKNPDFQNPDAGFPSGILRGLEWGFLTGDERKRVVKAWHAKHCAEQQQTIGQRLTDYVPARKRKPPMVRPPVSVRRT